MTRTDSPQDYECGHSPQVIVVGGSAGGLDAVMELLRGLPAEVTLPIVIVLHLARRRPSQLAEVLASSLGRPVEEAQDKAPLTRSSIYVAPPDYHLLIDEGPSLALSADEPINHSLPSIDVLFESAADVLGSRVIGILLSGASDDGARGVHSIVDAGGCAMIQLPDEASSSAMPEAALRTSPEVPVLSVKDICERLPVLAATNDAL